MSTPADSSAVPWADPRREAAFFNWLEEVGASHRLDPSTLRIASADASFRRYLRIDTLVGGQSGDPAGNEARSRIIMDAPPEKENSQPFVDVAALMKRAGLYVPEVLAWNPAQGFLLLSDLGDQTMISAIDPARPEANLPLYLQAVDALITWQLASRPGVLPPYDATLLRRELDLFPDWYIAKHRDVVLDEAQRKTLDNAFSLIIERNLAWPSVYVHRDFMPRNLMTPTLGTGVSSLPPEGAHFSLGRPGGKTSVAASRIGVLDFQDAVYGPITYDIASLMRDAFLSWEEDFVLEVTIRYWEKARKAGLPVGDDFGEFYKAVEWMGLQRHLKVAGIFARLTLRDGKPKYLADTPRFIDYIRATCGRYIELKPLMRLVERLENIQAVAGFAYGRV
jgi:aminoglycoside/choline kinase family phosphotransferase